MRGLCAADATDTELIDPRQLSDEVLSTVEADTFWCLSKLLDGIQVGRRGRSVACSRARSRVRAGLTVALRATHRPRLQDNYTQSQPGIQRRILRLKELIQRIDGTRTTAARRNGPSALTDPQVLARTPPLQSRCTPTWSSRASSFCSLRSDG